MLKSLEIENYALIDSLRIDFEQGMTVVTGETGAGKSIMMGALSLILGNRADTSVLADGQKKCVVEAEFDVGGLSLESFFDENNLDYQQDTIIRREISESGKSRAFINDTPVNLAVLKNFSTRLIDIHSQHQNLLFGEADFRVNVIDEFAGIRSKVIDYQSDLADYRHSEDELAALREQQKILLEKRDFLEFVHKELEDAKLREGEQEELEQEVQFLSHTESIKANLFQSLHLLSEKEESVLDEVREVKGLCNAISSYHSDIEEVNNRIESLFIDLKDIVSEISSINDRVDYDPELLEMKKQRLDLLYSLQQKHHVASESGLIAKMNAVSDELSSLVSGDERISELEKLCAQKQKDLKNTAFEISQSRSAVASQFSAQIMQKIKQLGMPDGQFQVQVEAGSVLQKNGIDHIRFMFSGNKGVEMSELSKVASGGEMSRLMLAVKSVISAKVVLPTVVFDEIDVGISGEVAGKVAQMMKEMSRNRQLLVITHLPQIAAKGGSHYRVYKNVEGGKSRTHIEKLAQAERIREIAKMMSGDKCGESVLKAAQELIEQ